jgi:hypothetical protein
MAKGDGKWDLKLTWKDKNGKTATSLPTIEASTLTKAKAEALDRVVKKYGVKKSAVTTTVVKTVREPDKSALEKAADGVNKATDWTKDTAKGVGESWKVGADIMVDWVFNTKHEKADAFLSAVDTLDNVAGALADMGIAKDVFEKIGETTGKITKVKGVFDCVKNLKKCYDIGKECNAAPTGSLKRSELYAELLKANLDFFGSVGSLKANAVTGKLLEYVVDLGKSFIGMVLDVAKAARAKVDNITWTSEVIDYDDELCAPPYSRYAAIGLQMWENMSGDPYEKCAKIQKVMDALIVLDNAKAVAKTSASTRTTTSTSRAAAKPKPASTPAKAAAKPKPTTTPAKAAAKPKPAPKPAPAKATVTKVTVTPAAATVSRGATKQFRASVTGTNNPAKTVKWSLTGASTGTKINADGLLKIGANQTPGTITVKAASTASPSKSGKAAVKVPAPAKPVVKPKPKPAPVKPVVKPKPTPKPTPTPKPSDGKLVATPGWPPRSVRNNFGIGGLNQPPGSGFSYGVFTKGSFYNGVRFDFDGITIPFTRTNATMTYLSNWFTSNGWNVEYLGDGEGVTWATWTKGSSNTTKLDGIWVTYNESKSRGSCGIHITLYN